MYGDTDVMRRHVSRLREQGTEIRSMADQLVSQAEAVTWEGRAGDAMRERIRERATRLRDAADQHDHAADTLESHTQLVDELKESIAETERRATALLDDGALPRFEPPAAGPQGLAGGHPARRRGPFLMPTIDLGPPRPTPHDLLDGLPRRVALTLPELRFAAIRANGAPLPFDLREGDADDGGLDDRLGGSRGSPEQAAYAEALARLHDPADVAVPAWPAGGRSRRRGRRGGPPRRHRTVGHAQRSRSTSTSPPGLSRSSRGTGRAAARSLRCRRQDGLVFELAWFPTWAWAAELARAAVVPEDLPLHDSVVPDLVTLPHELADAAIEAARTHRTDLVPVLVEQHPGAVTDGSGRTLTDGEVVRALTGLATEARGRLRALVADVSGQETSTVGVVAWTLVADGWRALRAHQDDDGLRLEVARVIPEDLAAELAPVLAEVSP